MPGAFAVARDRVSDSFTPSDDAAVAEHTAVAYVLSPPFNPGEALSCSLTALRLVATLMRDGLARGVKGESSGIAHGRTRWLDLASRAGVDSQQGILSLYNAWVRRPLREENGDLHSCGMHLLGKPDGCVRGVGADDWLGVRLIDSLNLALLGAEDNVGADDVGAVSVGRGMLRTASFVPSDLDEDDFMFNPHGFAVVADMALPRLSVDELTEAKTASSLSGKTTGFHLVEMGVLSDRGLADYLAAHFGVPAIPLDGVDIDSAIVGLIPRELAVRWLVVPVNRVDETLVIALSDPSNLPAVDDVRRVTGLGVEVVLASPGEIQRALARLYP